MRKISMFLICSTLLAVPAFAEDNCSDDKVKIGDEEAPTWCAKPYDANNQPAAVGTSGDPSQSADPELATKCRWIHNPDYGSYACLRRGDLVRCACGITECKPGKKATDNGLKCVEWSDDDRLRNGGNSAGEEEPVGAQDVTEEAVKIECNEGFQVVGDERLPCAKDANNNVYVVDVNETCLPNKGIDTENTKTCAWRTNIVADTYYACKARVDGPFVRCVYRITECVDNNFESRDGGLTCQQKAADQPAPAQQPADPKSISILAGRLAKVEGQFGLSKWRTADGEFNKARLASDLTAGVVLGTTGALVTSSVVKKKQVKEGFEALECTIGGQHVGDWGDKFHISGK